MEMRYTEKQGQYLAFIYNYSKKSTVAHQLKLTWNGNLSRRLHDSPDDSETRRKGAGQPSTWTATIDPVVDTPGGTTHVEIKKNRSLHNRVRDGN